MNKGKKCKPLLRRHVIFYEESFLSKIENIDSSFSEKTFFPFHTWLDFLSLISGMETLNNFDKTRVDILNFRQESFCVKDHMSL